jgi:ABC-type multidrug transport system fused ATPase/permease subunit
MVKTPMQVNSIRSGFMRSLSLFPKKDRVRLAQISIVQLSLGILDLIGVSLIGVLGALSVSGVQSQTSGSRVMSVLNLLGLSEYSFQLQVAILGSLAATVLITRTLISVFFSRKILFYISRKGAQLTSDLTSKMLSLSISQIEEVSKQQLIYNLTAGVNSISLGVIGTSVTLLSDVSLVIIMSIGLFAVDPTLAGVLVCFFGLLIFSIYLLLHKRVQRLGAKESTLIIRGNNQMFEAFNSFREILVSSRRGIYLRKISSTRSDLSMTTADLTFMPNVSKYVVESALILGALIMSAIQFKMQDARHAVATLTIFLAGGSRIAPAMMRLQQGAVTIKGSLGAGESTLQLAESLKHVVAKHIEITQIDFDHDGFNAEVAFTDVCFNYDIEKPGTLEKISFRINPGELVAIVGPSGAGKSTLADLLIGALAPTAGEILISNCNPQVALERWPGAISYVPQEVFVYPGTLRDNVALGLPNDMISEANIDRAIEQAQMQSMIQVSTAGKNLDLGGSGTRLSGGQKQRVGIARALYTNPKLLLLDEATSSLDSQLEADITKNLFEMKGSCTVIVIAHRLSTVRNADKVLYLDKGRLLASGTFNEVRSQIPNFDKQASLLGL